MTNRIRLVLRLNCWWYCKCSRCVRVCAGVCGHLAHMGNYRAVHSRARLLSTSDRFIRCNKMRWYGMLHEASHAPGVSTCDGNKWQVQCKLITGCHVAHVCMTFIMHGFTWGGGRSANYMPLCQGLGCHRGNYTRARDTGGAGSDRTLICTRAQRGRSENFIMCMEDVVIMFGL